MSKANNEANSLVVICRGASGSGKSTWAQLLMKDAWEYKGPYSCIIVSADHFFIDEETGQYNFDKSLLTEAHAKCFQDFREALDAKTPLIIVDNTNTRLWEFESYLKVAAEYNAKVVVHRLEGRFPNVHNVPEKIVRSQRDRMEDYPGEFIIAQYLKVKENN